MNKLFSIFIIPLVLFSQTMTSNLPIVIINTNNQTILDSPRIFCDMGIIYNNPELNGINDLYNNYNGKINIEIRGSSSQALFPKKSYSFETQNIDGSNNNISLLGLPEENDWVLYAPYSDKSLLRNVLSYSLFEKMGNYAPRTRYCELVLNGEYQGIYVLIEKIKRDKNRVNIKEISEDDITGGYIIKIDKLTDSDLDDQWCSAHTLNSGAPLCFQYHYPKTDDMNNGQKTYIQDFMDNIIYQIRDANNNGEDLYSMADINILSFIDYFIISELSKNIDAYRLSTYLYKDSDEHKGKINMGPIWDYNLAYGNVNYCNGFNPDGWLLHEDFDCGGGIPIFWSDLLENTSFQDGLLSRWKSLRETTLNVDSIFNTIDEIVLTLKDAKDRNFNKWDILREYVWPNYSINRSHRGEIEFLKYWLFNRIAWIDKHIMNPELILDFCSIGDTDPVHIIDPLGRASSYNQGGVLFYIYENGCVEKKLISYY